MAMTSILRRAPSVITFVAVDILLQLLGISLSSPEDSEQASAIMGSFFVKLAIRGILTALTHHIVVGIHHIMMGFDHLEEIFEVGKHSTKISLIITVMFSLPAGVLA